MNAIIKTGICSYGMSGKLFHAPFIHAHPGFELTAIVERSKNEARQRYPDIKVYRSVEELIADEELQLIIVNTPSYSHYEYAKAAIQAGKNVVIEKPMVVKTTEGEELLKLANEKGVQLSVYQNRRYDGDYRAVRDVLQQKLLGEVKEVEIRYDRYRPVFSGKAHKEGDLPGTGTLYDLGPHLIDQALQFFGWPQALFADVWPMRPNAVAVDYFELLLYYPGLRVRLKASNLAIETPPSYMLNGTKGSFFQQRSDLQEQQLLAGATPSLEPWCIAPSLPDGLLHIEENGQEVRKEMHSTPGNYMGYFQDLYLMLAAHAPNPVSGEDGLRNIKIIEAALRSTAEKRIIEL